MLSFVCPQCKTPTTADDQPPGSVVACPSCGLRMRLPSAPSPAVAVSPDIQGESRHEPALAEVADEDEAALRAELPPDYPPEASELGRPRFRVERMALPDNAMKPAFAAVLAAIPGVICIAAGPLFPRILGILSSVLLLGFAGWFIAWQLRKTKVYAVAHTGGFVLYDGRRFTTWRWADIASVHMQDVDQRSFVYFIEVNRLLTKSYRLRRSDGTEYFFWSTQGPRAAQFGLLVEKETYALMMPAAVARLQQGKTVDFPPFQMSEDGLTYGGQLTPWAECGPATIERGRLHVRGIGPGRSGVALLLEKIDNAHVFLPLLDQNLPIRPGK